LRLLPALWLLRIVLLDSLRDDPVALPGVVEIARRRLKLVFRLPFHPCAVVTPFRLDQTVERFAPGPEKRMIFNRHGLPLLFTKSA
jgi:hypothetical protein